jgi:hypothetical protein
MRNRRRNAEPVTVPKILEGWFEADGNKLAAYSSEQLAAQEFPAIPKVAATSRGRTRRSKQK